MHLPEPSVLDLRPGDDPMQVLRERCTAAIGSRYAGASDARLTQVRDRLDVELDYVRQARLPDVLPHRRPGVRPDPRHGGAGRGPGSGAGSLVNHLLGISGIEPIEHGLLMERFCSPLRAQRPTSTSTSSPPGAPRSTSGCSSASVASGSPACR
ncbi:hypothetical protein GCM10025868_06900 [Angustibacter aerolatus]|uniref:Bacterial DNA polymerase III alpha subunit NTPase domain-containing protein n=1 Tax=Angustibacter aerolatus TaxID=1162965 RepID=A0ABQ6JB85_9ACTN|nr:hypothetical protein [Angustibacter aerolatus]GMA85440.1 hypothetical protein GCM10025868_06900 [Angustibacter aerolatus]